LHLQRAALQYFSRRARRDLCLIIYQTVAQNQHPLALSLSRSLATCIQYLGARTINNIIHACNIKITISHSLPLLSAQNRIPGVHQPSHQGAEAQCPAALYRAFFNVIKRAPAKKGHTRQCEKVYFHLCPGGDDFSFRKTARSHSQRARVLLGFN
jgi:hypothetical protein